MGYPHKDIETKWQKAWDEKRAFRTILDKSKPKYYVLDMFPYPSAAGIHLGHPAGYTATDVLSRYKRTKGFNVLHPMGWDAFGLPAEQYAIKTGVHPTITTQEAITNFRRELKTIGLSYDWDREISTCDPKYYKWTQLIFTKLFEKGLAYQKEAPVNWCPALKTVLANEEVVDGKSERGGHPVIRVPMKQWMLKITAYAEKLLAGLDKVDWPERTKEAQRYWIGKSEGAKIEFKIKGSDKTITVFTTRPDTIFGATFMVLAPEHSLVSEITTSTNSAEVKRYVETSSRKSDVDRQIAKEKTGAPTGAYAINPLNGAEIPVWIADYVLMGYGTGAIMAVPAHDSRDFEFAQQFKIPVIRVIEGGELPYEAEGTMVNSGFLNGTPSNQAVSKAISYFEKEKLGERTVQYKFRDWLFSRQRYWGEPFPIVHYPNGDLKTVPANELPVLLPQVADYEPTETGESPLGRDKNWVNLPNGAKRETDTMPGSAGSSWYFLRYTDPNNDKEAFSFEAQDYWMPVDLYLGGAEHTVGHLLYSRFWQHVMFDAGMVSHPEPFQKLIHQGMILGSDNEKMSKSKGNGVSPTIITDKYGADALRVYILFMGPLDKDKPWSDQGVEGARRFLDRVYRAAMDERTGEVIATDIAPSEDIKRALHKTIKKVSEDIESLGLNTAISQMMIFVNELYKTEDRPKSVLLTLSQLLMPFAPHLAEEMWSKLGGQGLVSLAQWPSFDPALVKDDTITMGVQVNGKMRGTIEIAPDASEATAVALTKNVPGVQNALTGLTLNKVIYKAGKILNLIAK